MVESDFQRACREALRAVHDWEREYYSAMARANLLLFPAAIIGVAGNLWLWTR